MPDRRIAVPLLLLVIAGLSTPALGQAGGAAPAVKAHRWIDWQAAAIESRYRLVENSAGVTTTNQLQGRQTTKLGVLFDGSAATRCRCSWAPAAVSPAAGIRWARDRRADVGSAHPPAVFSAAPVAGSTFELGGIGLLRGEATEITSWDNDGYMTGERATLRRPRQLYLDEISITSGFLGDLSTPDVFHRFDRLDDHNYTQVLASKRLGRVALSGDWTSYDEVTTLREAARVSTKKWAPLDAVRVELYQRVEETRGNGFAVAAERALTSTVGVSGGYADIDRHNGALTGDRYGIGRRLFVETRVALLPAFSISAFYGHEVNNAFAVSNGQRFDVVATWNVLKSLQRAGLW